MARTYCWNHRNFLPFFLGTGIRACDEKIRTRELRRENQKHITVSVPWASTVEKKQWTISMWSLSLIQSYQTKLKQRFRASLGDCASREVADLIWAPDSDSDRSNKVQWFRLDWTSPVSVYPAIYRLASWPRPLTSALCYGLRSFTHFLFFFPFSFSQVKNKRKINK